MFSEITDFPFLEKIHFYIFWAPKNQVFFILRGPQHVFWSPNLNWPVYSWFWGGHSSCVSWFNKISKSNVALKSSKKTKPRSSNVKSKTLQNHRLRRKNLLDSLNNLGPLKWRKLEFWGSKNEKIYLFIKKRILWFHWTLGSLPQWLGSICSISRFDKNFGLG